MAYLVELSKVSEDDLSVVYSFKSFNAAGSLKLEKASGEVEAIDLDDSGAARFAFERAARRVSMAREKDEYPEKLTWHS